MHFRSILNTGFILALVCGQSLAENISQDFESHPNANPNWEEDVLANGVGGWWATGGTASITSARSVSGQQSLAFGTPTSSSGNLAYLGEVPGAAGPRFLDMRVQMPVGQTVEIGASPTGLSPQLMLNSLPALLAGPVNSSTTQLYVYSYTNAYYDGGAWMAVGPPLELENGRLKQWLRLTVRTDTSTGTADLWMNGRLMLIDHIVANSYSSSISLNLAANQLACLDDFACGDINPLYPDADADSMPDLYEYENGMDGFSSDPNDRNLDRDLDGLTNIQEYWLGTNPNSPDTDGDQMPDRWEFDNFLNPLSAADASLDSDRDGYSNLEEYNAGADPQTADERPDVVFARADVPLVGVTRDGSRYAPYATIQEAVENVASGGRIVLLGSPATFTGSANIDIFKPVSILGRSENNHGVSITGNTTAFGFTIATPPPPPNEPNTGPVIFENVTFLSFARGSSAITANQVPVLLRGCTFDNCSATATLADGGAVFMNNAALTVENCAFRTCTSKGRGGAIYALLSDVTILRSRFLSCKSTTGDGAAVFLSGTSSVIENSLFYTCTILTSGQGVVACADGSTVGMKYCTLLGNKAPTVAGNTAGIFNANAIGAFNLNSCILWDNKLNSGYKLQVKGLVSASNCTFDSQTIPGTNNNTTNPIFRTGTPYLSASATATSALAGDATIGIKPATDLDGTARVAPVERGCYEFSDPDGDGMASGWEILYGFNPNEAADSNADYDQDGYTNAEEYLRQSDPKVAATADTSGSIYVDPVLGSDQLLVTGTFTAPVKSIGRAFALVTTTRTRICLRNGIYSESGNRDITFMTPATNCLIKAINGNSSVTVDLLSLGRFLTLTNSTATNYGYTTTGQLTIQSITFRNGYRSDAGGAIYLPSGPSSLIISGCRFIGCNATQGGAIYDSSISPTAGTGSYSMGSPTANCLSITFCEFIACEASDSGGALHSAENSRLSLTASSFSYNTATNQAGALYSRATKGMAIKDCVFFRNTSPQGGAMAISNLTGASVAYGFQNWLLNCDFKENIATATDATTPIAAGALLIANSDTDLHACRFTANAVGTYAAHPGSGGAVLISSGAPQIFGSTFAANESASAGGAIRITGGTPHIVNCALVDNLAGTEGGGISIAEAIAPASPPATTILHTTLAFNRAPQGSAIYHRSNTILYNSLSWFNENLSTNLSSIEGTATLTAQGNNLSTTLTGNVSIQPALAFDKVHLVGPLPPASPSSLGSANYAYLYQAVELFPGNSSPSVYDYDYELRSMGTYPEAGCDEWQDSNADTLPDWFASYIAKYSTKDNLVTGSNVSATTMLLQGAPLTLGQMYANGTDPLHLTTDMDGDGVPDSLDTNPYDPKVYPMAELTPLAATVSFSYRSGFGGVPIPGLNRLWNKWPWYSRILDWTYRHDPLRDVSSHTEIFEYPNDALHRDGYESKLLQYTFPLTPPEGASDPGDSLAFHSFDHYPNRQITYINDDGSTQLETETNELVPIEGGDSIWSRIWASRPYPLPIAQTLELQLIWKKRVQIDAKYSNDGTLETPATDAVTIEKAEVIRLEIPANATTSFRYFDAMPRFNEPGSWTDDVSYYSQPPVGVREAGHQAAPGIVEEHEVILLPVELAPETLAANTDFDEGRIDSATGYAVPDCDDPQHHLEAEREHLDGRWPVGSKVTEDLHQGWFGVRPVQFATEIWNGATVTIKKIDKTDPGTDTPESGEVRFYATDGVNNTSGYQCIEPYDLTTHAAVNLVTAGIYGAPGRSVYGTTSDISQWANFWIEGVKPGKITLEWRYVKGSIDIKHEQTFLVATQKPAAEWRDEVRYQIRLQTSVANPILEADVSLLDPTKGFFKNSRYLSRYYYSYGQHFKQQPEKQLWAGMAKVAGAELYAGMHDIEVWAQWSEDPGSYSFLNDFLVTGAREIFNDMAWAHLAYKSSGIWALQYVEDNEGKNSVDMQAWTKIHEGIRDEDQAKMRDGAKLLLEREQKVVIQPYYVRIAPVKLKPPGGNFANWVGGVVVPVDADGKAEIGEWMSANTTHSPIPGGVGLRDIVPGGRLDNVDHRWQWITDPARGMLPIWTGHATTGPNLDAANRMTHVGLSMHDAALNYLRAPSDSLPVW